MKEFFKVKELPEVMAYTEAFLPVGTEEIEVTGMFGESSGL